MVREMSPLANRSYTPTISLPYTSSQFSFTAKVGFAYKVFHPSFFLSGYVSKQEILAQDSSSSMPAYGYLNMQSGAGNPRALMDFNREKEIPYHEDPPVPNIAVPSYTYDLFSISGEGTGGMFRAYRGDAGFIFDHFIRTKDNSSKFSADLGVTDLVHAGVDINLTRAYTQNSAWVMQNPLKDTVAFRSSDTTYEAVYFKNPAEKAINTKSFYNGIGGDNVVTAYLSQSDINSPVISTANTLGVYNNKRLLNYLALTKASVVKQQRDKRTQVITYLNAQEAGTAGLSKYIENYGLNQYSLKDCNKQLPDIGGSAAGLKAEYFAGNQNLQGSPALVGTVANIYYPDGQPSGPGSPDLLNNNFSVRWSGYLKAPATGQYTIQTVSDDGIRLWLNDSIIINHWNVHASSTDNSTVNLVAGQYYRLKVEYFQNDGGAIAVLNWAYPGQPLAAVPQSNLFQPNLPDVFPINTALTIENRVNAFRKPNHISEIDVLKNDGRRYVYGIPVYNLKEKDVTFSAHATNTANAEDTVAYSPGQDNTALNNLGTDNYYNAEYIPAYAHSFLLTGIVSPDYVDLTGDGITDDDFGDAVKFNYTKVAGAGNPYAWRAPYSTADNSATYNRGLKTVVRDDKVSYVYGEKELWYLNSVVSKTMVAVFVLQPRSDAKPISENGHKNNADTTAKCLKEIDLYTKADFQKNGAGAKAVKTVHFEYSYDLCAGYNMPANTTGKLTLKKVWFSYNGNDKGQLNPYTFNYNTGSVNPSYKSNAFDRWGNYKDPSKNPIGSGVLANSDYPYSLQRRAAGFGGSNGDSATMAQYAAAWTLDSIVLPSGGKIKVSYESDDYAYVQNKRAMAMFKIAGFSKDSASASPLPAIYNKIDQSGDYLYVYIKVSNPVTSKQDLYYKYLDGLSKLYFKISVKMPADKWGSGSESVPCYADLDMAGGYGFTDPNTIWVKIKGVGLDGRGGGTYSPLVKAATQFLRLNLPSKAYMGSDIGDNLDLGDAVNIIAGLASNVLTAFQSFDHAIRYYYGACAYIDTARSFVRLPKPWYRKFGGGLRVKKIQIFDNWNAMTHQKESVYGQQYDYTATKIINGVPTKISSGVANWEPSIGGEENPWHQPIEYAEQVSPAAPVTLGYTEEPLGESFFPSPSVGYSRVTVRSINTQNRRSANGYEETRFFTSYDFPTITDRSLLDGNTKKRYRPGLANFLRINAKHYISLSQGFKIELNDMNGKMRSQATYPENDSANYVSYTENFYKVDNQASESKHLANNVWTIDPTGTIDTAGLIGKDAEIMMDMREQLSITNGNNFNVNGDLFSFPFPPVFLIPSFLGLAQREENQYRSVATTKVIQRYGILDSVVHVDKGSIVSTKNILYDSETGDVVLTRTQNEFNSPVFNFSYPSHWAYDGMGEAYKNINAVFGHVTIRNGRITKGIAIGRDTVFFTGGDELLIQSKPLTGNLANCDTSYATFPIAGKIWAVDTSVVNGGPKAIYFVDANGAPFSGNDIYMKIIRSGRRNINTSVGGITTLLNPLVLNAGQYSLKFDTTTKVLNASAASFKQVWKVADRLTPKSYQVCSGAAYTDCAPSGSTTCSCECLRKLFDYLISANRLFIRQSDNITVDSLVRSAQAAGKSITMADCPILSANTGKLFYALTAGAVGTKYSARIGDCTVSINSTTGTNIHFTALNSVSCNSSGKVYFQDPAASPSCKSYSVYSKDWCNFHIGYTDCSGVYHDSVLNVTPDPGNGVCTGYYNNSSILARPGSLVANAYYSNGGSDFVRIDSGAAGSSVPDSVIYLKVDSCLTCSIVNYGICYSAVTDTTVNPYVAGLFGNFRQDRSYVFYTDRTETDPSAKTNIKKNGALNYFSTFWAFQSGRLVPTVDTTYWVWNSESTMFNQKGYELENKDPLGRYNAALYGYNLSLPTAVVQNSQYKSAAYEGFEDYYFGNTVCDTTCSASRRALDFAPYLTSLDSTQQHTGRYSLRVNASQSITVAASTLAPDYSTPYIKYDTTSNCTAHAVLKDIDADGKSLLPKFAPSPGDTVVLSAWVKEAQDCSCTAYSNNNITVTISRTGGSTQVIATPTGNIIEGWQRYETVIPIPSDATSIALSLKATGSVTTYFDDIRIHPYNANMKSFVYDPVTLRLVAELDENNYSSFYEYDNDGTPVRVKKETERGIKTIKETRSALLKQ